MKNSIYQLIEPHNIIRIENEITDEEAVLVKPTHLSICNADQRYYQGTRDAEVLARKLPMALIHEGIGEVIRDTSGEFQKGDIVVMIPNTPCETHPHIAENYLRSSKFRGSGFDGFMQEVVSMRRDRLVKLPEGIDLVNVAFSEIVSVCMHTIDRFIKFSHEGKSAIGVWGDGSLAYITTLLLKYRLPDSKIFLFCKHPERTEIFTHVDKIYEIREIPQGLTIDHAFECVGGAGSPKAINQIIDYINPEGTIAIMGVSENAVPINTRMILEKGLKLIGSSRSGVKDFENTVKLYREHPEIIQKLGNIVNDVIDVRSIPDIHLAFEKDIAKNQGKTIMLWNI